MMVMGCAVKVRPLRSLLLMLVVIGLEGCQSPDRALFVTATRLGVGYDLATTTGHVGYERAEIFVGPAYPQDGTIPPVAASLNSDLAFLAPSVHQLYATGKAAVLVTGDDKQPGKDDDSKWDMVNRRLAIVGTHTHVGLIIKAENSAVSQLDFGYGREEATLLPLRDLKHSGTDIYPSTLAGISVEVSSGGSKLSQFIATGTAARQLAVKQEVKDQFVIIAKAAATEAAKAAVGIVPGLAGIRACVVSNNMVNSTKLKQWATTANVSPATVNSLSTITDPVQLDNALRFSPTARDMLIATPCPT